MKKQRHFVQGLDSNVFIGQTHQTQDRPVGQNGSVTRLEAAQTVTFSERADQICKMTLSFSAFPVMRPSRWPSG